MPNSKQKIAKSKQRKRLARHASAADEKNLQMQRLKLLILYTRKAHFQKNYTKG